MTYTLIFKDKTEEREILRDDYKICDLLDELDLNIQTIVSKQNNETVNEDTLINEGDEIKLIKVIYGG